MKITIEFDTDNAAFEDDFMLEVTKTLQQAKGAIIDSENNTGIRRPLKDTNGNRIGVINISSN
jgi:hypothetical protein